MTFDARETSVHAGQPFELYLFQTQTQTWRLTSADRAITFNNNSYEPEAIFRTASSQGQELKSGALTVTIPKTHELAQLFVSFIPPTPLSLVIFRGHEGEPESEIVTHFTGRITMALFGDDCELRAVPEQEILQKRIPGPKYQKPCNHILYDSGCTVDKALFNVSGPLTFVDDDVIKAAAFATQPDGWLDSGYIEFGTERRMILNHVGDTLTLLTGLASLTVGTVVTAFAGCKRTIADCDIKFANLPHFFGFEFIPARNPFDGLE